MGQRIRVLILFLVLSGAGLLVVSSVAQWWKAAGEPQPPSALPDAQGRVRVEVLNGGGLPGAAREATRVLRDLGFDVVCFGNAETFSGDSSVVMDRVGRPEMAGRVAGALGIGDVRSEPDSTLFVDVTVRLGPEWSSPGAREEAEDSSAWSSLLRSPPQHGAARSAPVTGR